ncbi:DUF5677 domain-containing protein [Paraclostridium sordellii]|uniref:DUF5677 domain-containing protein n=1 Tax=Paraclostridium sordellii TaxID=1505 RepID=UPI0030D0ECE2
MGDVNGNFTMIVNEVSNIIADNLFNIEHEIEESGRKEELIGLQRIATVAQLTSESTIILVSEEKVFDAEILLRVVLEATVKMIYMSIGDEEERKLKSQEFWHTMAKIDKLKKSIKVKTLIETFPIYKETALGEYLELDRDIDDFQKITNRKFRKDIENKWSFNKMIEDISNNSEEWKDLKSISLTYNQSSNLTHMDSISIGMIIDRMIRPELQVDHMYKILSHVLILSEFRLKSVYSILGKEFKRNERTFNLLNLVEEVINNK